MLFFSLTVAVSITDRNVGRLAELRKIISFVRKVVGRLGFAMCVF